MAEDAVTPRAPMRDQPGGRGALVIIDMVNCFDFPEADKLLPKAVAAARAIAALKREMTERGWPVVYVNDNFGEWHSEKSRLIERAMAGGNPALDLIAPTDEDYFVIKPQFSGFYSTNLAVLLPKLGVRHLILTGIATDICILFTAADAHMRDYVLWVPEDAVAAEQHQHHDFALAAMRRSMGARTDRVGCLTISDWIAERSNSVPGSSPGQSD